jgi:hypothetical protein
LYSDFFRCPYSVHFTELFLKLFLYLLCNLCVILFVLALLLLVLGCNWPWLAVVEHMNKLTELNYCYYVSFPLVLNFRRPPGEIRRTLSTSDTIKKTFSCQRHLILLAVCNKESLNDQIDTAHLSGNRPRKWLRLLSPSSDDCLLGCCAV